MYLYSEPSYIYLMISDVTLNYHKKIINVSRSDSWDTINYQVKTLTPIHILYILSHWAGFRVKRCSSSDFFLDIYKGGPNNFIMILYTNNISYIDQISLYLYICSIGIDASLRVLHIYNSFIGILKYLNFKLLFPSELISKLWT